MGCELLPGQFAIGREAAAEELGVSGSAWYRGMQKLQEFGCIRVEANNRFTKVSIVNWAKYQDDLNNKRTTSEQREDSQRTATEQQADTIEEGLEGKTSKKSKKNSHTACELPKDTHLVDPQFQAAWDRWGRHLLENQKVLTPTVSESQLYKLADFSVEESIEIIEFSILRGSMNLILNGDHKRTNTHDDRPRGKRRTPGVEAII